MFSPESFLRRPTPQAVTGFSLPPPSWLPRESQPVARKPSRKYRLSFPVNCLSHFWSSSTCSPAPLAQRVNPPVLSHCVRGISRRTHSARCGLGRSGWNAHECEASIRLTRAHLPRHFPGRSFSHSFSRRDDELGGRGVTAVSAHMGSSLVIVLLALESSFRSVSIRPPCKRVGGHRGRMIYARS